MTLSHAGALTLTGTPQTVVGGPATITVGPSGKIIATYSGDVNFENEADTAEVEFSLDGTPDATTRLDVQAPTFASETLTLPMSRTCLFTGLTPGTSHTVDAQMTSSGTGDTATLSTLVISTF